MKVNIQSVFQAGFTLLELMVVIAIVGILATIAIPSFSEMMKNERMGTQNNELLADIALARSETIRRGKRVTMCPTEDQQTCSADWSTGRMIFVDEDRDMEVSLNEAIVRVRDKLAGRNTMTWSGGVQRLQFRSSGIPSGGVTNGASDSFKICDATKTNLGRIITVSSVGEINVRSDVTCP